MPKWLVTHTVDGQKLLQDIVEADNYSDAYFKVLYKMPQEYAVGNKCCGIISVVPSSQDAEGLPGHPTIKN